MRGFLKNSKLLAFIVIMLMLSLGSPALSVGASGYYSYVYNANGIAVAAPAAAEPASIIKGADLGIGDFDSPQDMFIDKNGSIYIADSKNNRIVILDKKHQPVKLIEQFDNNGKIDTFLNPCGVYADDNGSLYIADTGNARIIHLQADETLKRIILFPENETVPEDFIFKPTKLAVDAYGRMFVVSEGFNMGLMEFDASGQYLKSMGAPTVAISLIDQIWRRFSTKQQQERMQSYVPVEYSSVTVDSEGFLFVTTSSYELWQYKMGKVQPLRKLNAKGSDVFNRVGNPAGDAVLGGVTYQGPSLIVDFSEISSGNFGILDQKRGRVFVYNSEGELLYQFGGPGNYKGGMASPVALSYFDEQFFVLDSNKKIICVYNMTEYGQLFNDIAKARNSIDYQTEEALWKQVMQRNVNCSIAARGLGNAAYKKQDMPVAMQYYRTAQDRENYSKAYAFVRREWIENNVGVMMLAVVLTVAGAVLFFKVKKMVLAKQPKNSYLSSLNYAGHILLHPLAGYWDLKREKRGNLKSAATLLLLTITVMILSNLYTGFTFNYTNLHTYSMFGNIAFVFAAVALWCVSQWCVTSLMDGEGKFYDIFMSTCYFLTPYIILNTVGIFFSRVLLISEGDLYHVLISLSIVWMALLLIASIMQTHNYSLTKSLLVILIIIIVILLIIFIAMLVIALMQQMIAFIKDLYDEGMLRT